MRSSGDSGLPEEKISSSSSSSSKSNSFDCDPSHDPAPTPATHESRPAYNPDVTSVPKIVTTSAEPSRSVTSSSAKGLSLGVRQNTGFARPKGSKSSGRVAALNSSNAEQTTTQEQTPATDAKPEKSNLNQNTVESTKSSSTRSVPRQKSSLSKSVDGKPQSRQPKAKPVAASNAASKSSRTTTVTSHAPSTSQLVTSSQRLTKTPTSTKLIKVQEAGARGDKKKSEQVRPESERVVTSSRQQGAQLTTKSSEKKNLLTKSESSLRLPDDTATTATSVEQPRDASTSRDNNNAPTDVSDDVTSSAFADPGVKINFNQGEVPVAPPRRKRSGVTSTSQFDDVSVTPGDVASEDQAPPRVKPGFVSPVPQAASGSHTASNRTQLPAFATNSRVTMVAGVPVKLPSDANSTPKSMTSRDADVSATQHQGPQIWDPFESLNAKRQKEVAERLAQEKQKADAAAARNKSATKTRKTADHSTTAKARTERQNSAQTGATGARSRRKTGSTSKNASDVEEVKKKRKGSGRKRRNGSKKDKEDTKITSSEDDARVALIGGIDWHVETGCNDTAHVRAARLPLSTSDGSEEEEINIDVLPDNTVRASAGNEEVRTSFSVTT